MMCLCCSLFILLAVAWVFVVWWFGFYLGCGVCLVCDLGWLLLVYCGVCFVYGCGVYVVTLGFRLVAV